MNFLMFQEMQFNLNFQLEIIFAPKFEFEFFVYNAFLKFRIIII